MGKLFQVEWVDTVRFVACVDVPDWFDPDDDEMVGELIPEVPWERREVECVEDRSVVSIKETDEGAADPRFGPSKVFEGVESWKAWWR